MQPCQKRAAILKNAKLRHLNGAGLDHAHLVAQLHVYDNRVPDVSGGWVTHTPRADTDADGYVCGGGHGPRKEETSVRGKLLQSDDWLNGTGHMMKAALKTSQNL
jgi:hypothetical protein